MASSASGSNKVVFSLQNSHTTLCNLHRNFTTQETHLRSSIFSRPRLDVNIPLHRMPRSWFLPTLFQRLLSAIIETPIGDAPNHPQFGGVECNYSNSQGHSDCALDMTVFLQHSFVSGSFGSPFLYFRSAPELTSYATLKFLINPCGMCIAIVNTIRLNLLRFPFPRLHEGVLKLNSWCLCHKTGTQVRLVLLSEPAGLVSVN